MSASFSVTSSTGTYDVAISAGLFAQAAEWPANSMILADEFLAPHLPTLTRAPILIPALESNKSLERLPALIEHLRIAGVDRGTTLIAVGGGIIQDIAAFAASVYMRGLDWVYVPTTVLAMVDSCIGGKSSINVGPYKNLVGTFHPPRHIRIDPLLASTLHPEHFAGGLVEAAKICFCRGPESFNRYLSHTPAPEISPTALEEVILESLQAKQHFIEIDEFDQKERLLLNFGHTFGHALEGASNYGIPHGMAVGLGILCSLAFQQERGIPVQAIQSVMELKTHLDELVRTLPHLNRQLDTINMDEVLNRFRSDKKHRGETFSLILISAEGTVQLERHPRTPDVERSILRAFETVREIYTK